MNWVFVTLMLVPVAIGIGQLLFKRASMTFGGVSAEGLTGLLFDKWFLSALCIYGLSTVAWVAVLRHVDISRANQCMALTFVIVPIGGVLFFGERMTANQIAGIAIIIAGISIANS